MLLRVCTVSAVGKSEAFETQHGGVTVDVLGHALTLLHFFLDHLQVSNLEVWPPGLISRNMYARYTVSVQKVRCSIVRLCARST